MPPESSAAPGTCIKGWKGAGWCVVSGVPTGAATASMVSVLAEAGFVTIRPESSYLGIITRLKGNFHTTTEAQFDRRATNPSPGPSHTLQQRAPARRSAAPRLPSGAKFQPTGNGCIGRFALRCGRLCSGSYKSADHVPIRLHPLSQQQQERASLAERRVRATRTHSRKATRSTQQRLKRIKQPARPLFAVPFEKRKRRAEKDLPEKIHSLHGMWFSTPTLPSHIPLRMVLRVILIFAAMFVSGCGYNPTDQLLGAWEGSEPSGARTVLVFEKGGRLSILAGAENGTGTYVVHKNSAPVHLDLDFQLGDTPISAKSILVFLSPTRLKLAQPAQDRPSDFSGKVLLLTRRTL